MKFVNQLILPFTNDFPIAYSAVGYHFTQSRTSFRIGANPLKPCFTTYVYVKLETVCYHFNNLHSTSTRS